MRRDLTDALIRTLHAPAGGRLEIWDGRCEGLVLRVSDRGRVTFHARARGADGRKRFAALGTWPSLSLAQARTEARVTIGLMQKGGDPTAERRSARAERVRDAAMPSLRELGAAWANAHARDTSARYRAELIATIGRGCGDLVRRPGPDIARGPALMAQRIDTITAEDIAGVVQAARTRGDGEARHLVRGLRRLFGFALAVGHVQTSVVDEWLRREKGGRRSIPWLRDGIRERVLSDAEVTKLWNASASLDVPARAFTRLLLLTACRSGEITGLGWREIERGVADQGAERFTALVLSPARTKNRRGHRVPLATAAAAELQALAPPGDARPPGTGLVFPGIASRTAGICRALRKAAGVDDWTWHDFRRTAATTMARLGCPREHVEAALNHISARGGLTGIYQRYHFDQEAARALLLWQAHVASLVASQSTADHQPPDGKRMTRRAFWPRRRRLDATTGGSDPDPPTSSGAATADKGQTGAWRVRRRMLPAPQPGRRPDEPSHPPAAASGPSVTGKIVSPRAMIAKIPRADWELAEAVQSPVGRQPFRQVRAATATKTRREADDDAVLLRIELHRRANPRISVEKAVRDVIASLRTDHKPDSSDERVVQLGDRRFVGEVSAVKHLAQKFRKYEPEIVRRADSWEFGRKSAQLGGGEVEGLRGVAELLRHAADLIPRGEIDPAVRERAARLLDGLSLPDAADAVLQELNERSRRRHSQDD